MSRSLAVVVLGLSLTGSAWAGTTDSGMTDSGTTDSGMTDSGTTDSGMTDSGETTDSGSGGTDEPAAYAAEGAGEQGGIQCGCSSAPLASAWLLLPLLTVLRRR